MTKPGTLAPRAELSEVQRALLKQRLKHARETTAAPQEGAGGIPRRESREAIPLSAAQQRLWFIDQLEPNSPAYNMSEAVRLSGPLDVPALERSLNAIIHRHEILRTNFVSVDGSPLQVIADRRTLSIQVRVPSRSADVAAETERLIDEEARRPFDLRSDLLLRVLLISVGPEEHVFMFTMHHIISDGWSQGVFFGELAELYDAAVTGRTLTLPELPVQYADFVLWEKERLHGPVLSRQLAYWKHQLRGVLPVLELPMDHPHPFTSSSPAATQTRLLSPELVGQLKALSQREGATLFMTLLAAFQVLLHRYTGEVDVVTGSVVAGRPQVSLEKLIGFFVNTVVFRGNLAGDPSFRELLARTQDTTLDALANQELPFSRVVEELHPDRSPSQNPVFNVMFVLQNTPAKPERMAGLKLQPRVVEGVCAKFDLMLLMEESSDGLLAILEYNADLFERETIKRMLGHLQVLLEGIAADPARPISALPLLSVEERRQLLIEWNRTETVYPRDRTIVELFADQVAKTPKDIAVVCAGHKITYKELDERAGRLASRLRQSGVGPDVVVGVCLERSLELVVALLAIIKAGGAYVSLDPSCWSVDRLGFILVETKAPVLVTAAKQESLVASLIEVARATGAQVNPAVIRVDSALLAKSAGVISTNDNAARVTPESLACVSYTAGSTGTPKGVGVTHRGIVRLVKDANFGRFDSSDVFLQLTPVAFGAAALEIWAPLLNGGRLVVCPPGQPSLSSLGECIQKNGVTVLCLTADLFHGMAEAHLGYLKNVRVLLAGGGVLSVPLVQRTLQQLPRTRLIHGYGQAETTTLTCGYAVEAAALEAGPLPIGRPLANTQVYVLDANRQPVPIGVAGELYVGGDGLARGYLNQPAMTADKFALQSLDELAPLRLYRTGDRVRWLANGTLEFLGRMDRQVRIRGHRVEPEKIEAALLTHPSLKNCAVVMAKESAGGERLVGCLVMKPDAPSVTVEWADYLRRTLPDYRVPSAFLVLNELPLSVSGKVDYAALQRSAGEKIEPARVRIAPRDELERQLAELWEAVLGVSHIGIHDRFFELGGHSLLAVRLLAKIETTFGQKLPVSAVFQHPTVAQLGALLRSQDAAKAVPLTSIVEVQPHGSRPPIYFVHGVGGGMFWGYSNLSRHLGADQPVHVFKSRGLDGTPEWPTIREMAQSYVADLKSFQPQGPYVVGGYCFGGNVAYEMARQLKDAGDEVALLVLISSSPPNSQYESTQFRWSLPWLLKFSRNFGRWIVSFAMRWDAKERREFIRWKSRVVWRRLAPLFGAPAVEDPRDSNVDNTDALMALTVVNEAQRRLWNAHMIALRLHRPKPYDGKAVLIRSPAHLFLCSFDEQCGWGELVRGGVTVKIVPGDHGRILEEPFVVAAANELRRCLQENLSQTRPEGGA